MDVYFLRILNEYKQEGTFKNFSIEEFQTYCQQKYLYPISVFLHIITIYWESIENINDYRKRLNYFNQIVPYLYNGIYTAEDQQILTTYLVLLNSNRLAYGTNNQTIADLRATLDLIPTSKEATEIQRILKYNYTEFLILYSPNEQELIGQLLSELEKNPPQLTLNELSQYKKS